MADKRATFVTPRGVAVYPRLNEPDTKYNAAGTYSLRLRLPAEQAQPLIDRIESMLSEKYEATKAELIEAGKAKMKDGKVLMLKDGKPTKDKDGSLKTLEMADKCYRMTLDDDGEETGEVEFNIKMTASGVSKKTGKPWSRKPRLFDSKNKLLPSGVAIWGGSEVEVAGEFNPFYTTVGVGVSMRLEAVRVIKLVSGGNRDAGGYGFGEAVEGGYEAADEDAATEFGDSPAVEAGVAAADEEDF